MTSFYLCSRPLTWPKQDATNQIHFDSRARPKADKPRTAHFLFGLGQASRASSSRWQQCWRGVLFCLHNSVIRASRERVIEPCRQVAAVIQLLKHTKMSLDILRQALSERVDRLPNARFLVWREGKYSAVNSHMNQTVAIFFFVSKSLSPSPLLKGDIGGSFNFLFSFTD